MPSFLVSFFMFQVQPVKAMCWEIQIISTYETFGTNSDRPEQNEVGECYVLE